MKTRSIILLPALLLMMAGCGNTATFVTSATGSVYELLVVMNPRAWEGEAGDSTRAVMEVPMQGMPQPERTLVVSHVTWHNFNDMLKPVRNILLADIDSTKYTHAKISTAKNLWSTPQRVVKIQARNTAQYLEAVRNSGEQIRNYFVRSEIDRQISIYRSKGYFNAEVAARAKAKLGVSVVIPQGFNIIKDTTDMLWITDAKGAVRRDIVIYSSPLGSRQPDRETLLALRDSVMKRTISDGTEGSFMGTEYKYEPPVYSHVVMPDSTSAAEIRGLWKMYGGTAMGGPFVSQTRVDSAGQRLVSIEGFVFGPGQSKRTALRQVEAIANSLRIEKQ